MATANSKDRRPLLPDDQQSQIRNASSQNGVYREYIPNSREEEETGLLSHDGRDEGQAIRQATSPTRRIGWSFAGLFAISVAAAFALASLLLSLDPSKPSIESQADDHSSPPQPSHPEDRYILDPDWDFLAPAQVREYEWTITDGEGRPDGVLRPIMLINNQFPGPLIEMNEGDVLIVKLLNKASNATALHWHGIFQNGTNWMDGAAGVTQCPIAPGQSYQYKFNVTGQSGTCKINLLKTSPSTCGITLMIGPSNHPS